MFRLAEINMESPTIPWNQGFQGKVVKRDAGIDKRRCWMLEDCWKEKRQHFEDEGLDSVEDELLDTSNDIEKRGFSIKRALDFLSQRMSKRSELDYTDWSGLGQRLGKRLGLISLTRERTAPIGKRMGLISLARQSKEPVGKRTAIPWHYGKRHASLYRLIKRTLFRMIKRSPEFTSGSTMPAKRPLLPSWAERTKRRLLNRFYKQG